LHSKASLMADPIAFYFDFSSPYGYLAAQRIEGIGAKHGREVAWKPYLMGITFKTTGLRPLVDVPLKGGYTRHDLPRSARLLGVPFRLPEPFPFPSVAACRAYYWLVDRDRSRAVTLAKALYHAAFGQGRDVSGAAAVVAVAAELGVDEDALTAALEDSAVKDRLRAEVEDAMAKGAFGSPFVLVDGEPFWGHDRLDHVDRWLETGGW